MDRKATENLSFRNTRPRTPYRRLVAKILTTDANLVKMRLVPRALIDRALHALPDSSVFDERSPADSIAQ